MPESTPPPFKDITDRYQTYFDTQLQTGTAYIGGMEQIYEDWETQVCNVRLFPPCSFSNGVSSLATHNISLCSFRSFSPSLPSFVHVHVLI